MFSFFLSGHGSDKQTKIILPWEPHTLRRAPRPPPLAARLWHRALSPRYVRPPRWLSPSSVVEPQVEVEGQLEVSRIGLGGADLLVACPFSSAISIGLLACLPFQCEYSCAGPLRGDPGALRPHCTITII